MSKLQELFDYYNDTRNHSFASDILISAGVSRLEILKILAVLIMVERNSDE